MSDALVRAGSRCVDVKAHAPNFDPRGRPRTQDAGAFGPATNGVRGAGQGFGGVAGSAADEVGGASRGRGAPCRRGRRQAQAATTLPVARAPARWTVSTAEIGVSIEQGRQSDAHAVLFAQAVGRARERLHAVDAAGQAIGAAEDRRERELLAEQRGLGDAVPLNRTEMDGVRRLNSTRSIPARVDIVDPRGRGGWNLAEPTAADRPGEHPPR